ncbi:hypothetical protein, partial [Mixta calida]|uniref:hypothetical protein n=1 Tax=Mixta calida TaxID=665913 RepID=UPI0028AA080D
HQTNDRASAKAEAFSYPHFMKKCLDRLFFLLLYSFCPVFNAQFYTACLLLHKTTTQRADFLCISFYFICAF